MTLEQAVIRSGDTEVPVLVLQQPLTWVIAVMLFVVAILYTMRKK